MASRQQPPSPVKRRAALPRVLPLVLIAGSLVLNDLRSVSGQPVAAGAEPAGVPVPRAALAIENAFVRAIAAAEKSVVAVARLRKRTDPIPQDPAQPGFVPDEYGTGVVVSRDGLILTAYHVIGNPDENDYAVWVAGKPFFGSSRPGGVKILAADPWLDLAVLKIDATDLEPIRFGDTTNLRKGQIVIALGNPYAIARDGQVSASWGIISNLSRKATRNSASFERAEARSTTEQNLTLHHYGTLIQTDAKLNLGTSGGALINLKGEMIGLTMALAAMDRYEQAAGFAIPVDEAFRETLEKLKRGQTADFGFLGVAPRELLAEQRRQGAIGVQIDHVVQGTPADLGGLRQLDIITHVGRQPIHSPADLMRNLGKRPAGAEVTLKLLRNGQQIERTVTLSKKYISSARPAYSQTPPRQWRGLTVDYATAIPNLSFEATQRIDPLGCVAIVDVDPDSPAWKAGLRPNSFIRSVGDNRVANPDQFYEAVSDKTGSVRIFLTAPPGTQSRVRVVSPN